MASNTLTNLIPDLYKRLDVVSRELVGMIPSVTRDPDVARAAKGETVRSPVAPASTATDITPSNMSPDSGGQTFTNVEVTISKSRMVPISWTGEEQLGVNNASGNSANAMLLDQFEQAMRTLANEMESDLTALHVNASRAYGTPGTTPFATAGDFSDLSQTIKILKDNGAPISRIKAVIDTAAGANLLGKHARADVQGSDSMLRRGVLLDHMGAPIRESGQIVTSTAGTASGATTDTSGYAVGATTITLASAGTGTIVAGDVITFAGDTNQYVVASGDSDVSNGGTITLAEPGLRKAIAASATAITVKSASARNMVFADNAIVLANRVPAAPEGGDSADDSTILVDPVSGIPFEIRVYRQYRQVHYEVGAAWGVKAVKPEHIALLQG